MQNRNFQLTAMVAMALGIFTATCVAQGPTPAAGNVAAANTTSFANFQNVWLRISAFTDVPVAGATVSVYDRSGQLLFEEYRATNNRGVYPAWIKSLPSEFRVTVTSDSSWLAALGSKCPGVFTLSADVQNFDPVYGMVYVNPVTTLVSRVRDRDPQLSLPQARSRVRAFLDLPANASLGAAMRDETYYHSEYFSETAFVSEAARLGGIDKALDVTADYILQHPRAQHSLFARPQTVPPALAFIALNLGRAALHWAAGQGVGWVMQSSGLSTPGASPDAIEKLQKGLADLQSSVDQLSRQLQELTQLVQAKLTQTQYNQIVVPAITLSAQINGVESNLAFYAQGCPPLPEKPAVSIAPAFSEFCRDQKVTIVSQLNEVRINHSFETLSSLVLDNPVVGFKGLPHLYSQAMGETVRFFRPADSTKIRNMFDYWDAVQTQAANLKVELLHQNGAQNNPGGVAQLRNFLGDEDVDPPQKGVFQDTRDREAKLVFPAVPVGTVINTKDRKMWATAYPNFDNLNSPCYITVPPRASGYLIPITRHISWNGISGWISPTRAQAEALMEGRTGPTLMGWLIEQTRAVAPEYPTSPGFANILTVSPSDRCFEGRVGVWTSTITGHWRWPDGTTGPIAWVFDLRNGAFSTQLGGFTKSYYWIYLVRDLPPGEQYYWYP